MKRTTEQRLHEAETEPTFTHKLEWAVLILIVLTIIS